MLGYKLAAHAHDRIEERSTLARSLVDEAQKRLKDLPQDGATTCHWTARQDGQVLGHLAIRRVGKEQKPVVTTFLGPMMKPSGPEISMHLGPLVPPVQKEALISFAKEAAPRWMKVMRESPEMAKEVSKRMGLSEGLQDALALSPKSGLLRPGGMLPKAGLAQEGLDAANAQPLFKDPTLQLDTVVDMQTRDPKGRARHTKSLRDHLNTDDLEGRELVGDISPEDRLALNTHPNLLSKERWQRDESGRHSSNYADALQVGSNPALELQVMMDPEFAETLRDRVKSPFAARARLRKGEAPTSRARDLFEKKKEYLGQGERPQMLPPTIAELKGPVVAHGYRDWDAPGAKELSTLNAHYERATVGGHRPWYDMHEKKEPGDMAQLNFGITPPDIGKLGPYGARVREDAARAVEMAQQEADHLKEMQFLRSGEGQKQESLFWGDGSKIEYAPYKRTSQDRDHRSLEGLAQQRAEEARARQAAKQPPQPPAEAQAPASPSPSGPTPKPSGLVLGGLGGALGLAGLAKYVHSKRQKAQQDVEAE